MTAVIVDTGPLVAYLDRRATDHPWVREQFTRLTRPLLTCEPVLTEALFLLKRNGLNPEWLLELLSRGVLRCEFHLEAHLAETTKILRQYRDLPTTLADACLVRMSEVSRDSVVFTLDRDFLVYRRNGRQKIPLLAPFVP